MISHVPATLSRFNLTQHGVKSVVTNIQEVSNSNRLSFSGKFCPHCDAPACERDYVGQTQYIYLGHFWTSHVHVCDCCQRFFHIPVTAKEYKANTNG